MISFFDSSFIFSFRKYTLPTCQELDKNRIEPTCRLQGNGLSVLFEACEPAPKFNLQGAFKVPHIVQWGSHKILSKAKTSYQIINLNQIVFILLTKLFSWNGENSPSGAPAVQIYPSNSCWHIFLFIY